jgi:superfamily I DNA and/or RNA helicase
MRRTSERSQVDPHSLSTRGRKANAVFSTCIVATTKWARKFRHELGLNIINEAGAVTLLESLIVWNGDRPLILVGDNNQLPPPVMTARQQFLNKKPVNAFYKQLQQPFLQALIENNWPYWRLLEQMRVERSLFCPANHVIYSDHISYHPSVGCQWKARTSGMGCSTFARCALVQLQPRRKATHIRS